MQSPHHHHVLGEKNPIRGLLQLDHVTEFLIHMWLGTSSPTGGLFLPNTHGGKNIAHAAKSLHTQAKSSDKGYTVHPAKGDPSEHL